jgi:hypothetical protein
MKQKTNYLQCKYTLLIPGSSRAATGATSAEVLGKGMIPPIVSPSLRMLTKEICFS